MITYLTIPYLPGMYVCMYVSYLLPPCALIDDTCCVWAGEYVRAYVHGCMRAADEEGQLTGRVPLAFS